jgi:hypothetical protein
VCLYVCVCMYVCVCVCSMYVPYHKRPNSFLKRLPIHTATPVLGNGDGDGSGEGDGDGDGDGGW